MKFSWVTDSVNEPLSTLGTGPQRWDYRGSLLLSPTKYKPKIIVALIELTPRKKTSV